MSLYELKNEINRLPLAEQAALLDELWLKLNQEDALTGKQRTELDARFELYKSGQQPTIPASVAHKALRNKYL